MNCTRLADMTERLNTLEAKVRTCLYSSVWQKFPRVAAEKDVELAALERSGVCPSIPSEEHAVVVVLLQKQGSHGRCSPLAQLLPLPMQLHLCLPSSLQLLSSAPLK